MFVAVAVGAAGAAIGAGVQAYTSREAAKDTRNIANQQMAQQQEQLDYQRSLQEPFYQESLPAYRSLVSGITGQVDPATGKQWTPTNTPAFQWQQQQQEKNMGRRLRALGRENSTFGINAMADSNRNLLSNEWDKQLGRLQTLSGFATGGANSLQGISNNQNAAYENQASGMLAANLIGQQGINNAVQTGISGLNMGLGSLYQQPSLSGGNKGGRYGY